MYNESDYKYDGIYLGIGIICVIVVFSALGLLAGAYILEALTAPDSVTIAGCEQ